MHVGGAHTDILLQQSCFGKWRPGSWEPEATSGRLHSTAVSHPALLEHTRSHCCVCQEHFEWRIHPQQLHCRQYCRKPLVQLQIFRFIFTSMLQQQRGALHTFLEHSQGKESLAELAWRPFLLLYCKSVGFYCESPTGPVSWSRGPSTSELWIVPLMIFHRKTVFIDSLKGNTWMASKHRCGLFSHEVPQITCKWTRIIDSQENQNLQATAPHCTCMLYELDCCQLSSLHFAKIFLINKCNY